MKLYKTTNANAELLIDELELADGLFSRAKGLLGRKSLAANKALWIKPCNNIHTCFMNFAIDCVFIDKSFCINKIVSDVKPFKFIGPFWKSSSVIELSAGFVEAKKLKVGDQLYVVN